MFQRMRTWLIRCKWCKMSVEKKLSDCGVVPDVIKTAPQHAVKVPIASTTK